MLCIVGLRGNQSCFFSLHCLLERFASDSFILSLTLYHNLKEYFNNTAQKKGMQAMCGSSMQTPQTKHSRTFKFIDYYSSLLLYHTGFNRNAYSNSYRLKSINKWNKRLNHMVLPKKKLTKKKRWILYKHIFEWWIFDVATIRCLSSGVLCECYLCVCIAVFFIAAQKYEAKKSSYKNEKKKKKIQKETQWKMKTAI